MKKLGKKIRNGAKQINESTLSVLSALGAAATATAAAGTSAGLEAGPGLARAFKQRFGTRKIRCNLCNKEFRANSAFYRFCRTCKQEDELFRFYNWLPAQV